MNFRVYLNFRGIFFVYIFVYFLDKTLDGFPVSIYRGHLSPGISEDEMLRTLRLLDEDESPFWPTMKDITEMRRAEVSVDQIIKRKLINRQSLSFAPKLSLAGHLRECGRGKKSDSGCVSNREA